MPTYEYRCKSCGGHLEVVQSFTDDALTLHEGCGGELRKVFGSVGIAFKGSGFYKTDSRAKTSTGGGDQSTSDKGDSAAAASSSSDSGSSTAAGSSSSDGGSGRATSTGPSTATPAPG